MTAFDRAVMWTVRLALLLVLGAAAAGLVVAFGVDAVLTAVLVTVGAGSVVFVLVVFAVEAAKALLDAPASPAERSWLDTYSAHDEQAAVAGRRRW